MRTRILLILAASALMLMPMDVWAKPEVKVAITAEKEITVVENGQTVVKRVNADTVESGQTIYYTLTVTNDGDEKATNVVLNNPLPDGTAYVGNSSFGEGSTILFSADGGRHFDTPSRLMVTVKKADGSTERQPADPGQYTDIRWTLADVPPGKSLTLGYQASVK
ncbi:hypothetical protein [uncultured Desulfosarcina sp.]|uniref:hypothetical protein n=1 Tax=uncultured Desulfosarcina sp. TaxID=218289 RepID=UPI0029C78C26|nr:hypothetical protein [uncultured Desulfosarcina sp.]